MILQFLFGYRFGSESPATIEHVFESSIKTSSIKLKSYSWQDNFNLLQTESNVEGEGEGGEGGEEEETVQHVKPVYVQFDCCDTTDTMCAGGVFPENVIPLLDVGCHSSIVELNLKLVDKLKKWRTDDSMTVSLLVWDEDESSLRELTNEELFGPNLTGSVCLTLELDVI